jgi:hypothetical protein
MVGDEGADIAGGRVCQNINMDSPFSWFYLVNEIFPLKPTTDSSTYRFWPGIKCSLNLAFMYLRKLLTFCLGSRTVVRSGNCLQMQHPKYLKKAFPCKYFIKERNSAYKLL